MTSRGRQRDYYYRQLDLLSPGLRQRYERTYGERYSCAVPHASRLYHLCETLCQRHGIVTRLPLYASPQAEQLRLL
ncbi:MAG: hypothetical protein JW892_03295 [Anaerolineae bacterium]|nr:hypothetical protein [Anaerolineae bacterium]